MVWKSTVWSQRYGMKVNGMESSNCARNRIHADSLRDVGIGAGRLEGAISPSPMKCLQSCEFIEKAVILPEKIVRSFSSKMILRRSLGFCGFKVADGTSMAKYRAGCIASEHETQLKATQSEGLYLGTFSYI